jgi:DNA-binding MltR family transcriptional regulator
MFKIFGLLMTPAAVLVVTARLDTALKVALLSKMRPLSNKAKENLFEGYGPLASFAAKIDVAYALSVLDDGIYADLKVIKQIRNKFAHPEGSIKQVPDFDDNVLANICKKFRDYDVSLTTSGDGANRNFFDKKVAQCLLALSQDEDDLVMAKGILSKLKPK